MDLDDGHWIEVNGSVRTIKPGDTVIALYDVPFTPEARHFKVWYGLASAQTTVK